ncbi:YlbG family protein [Weissella tructae]|uniref:DUF2129 domain-containing protein n=2 Tax=Weissella TaxID=46255 RepID=A0A075TZV7_9LACO|nr:MULTISPECIES: YlbG family protein [Weissella]AIG65423.1 hypothetical protein WS08_0484 [Weissella tructae]AIM62736.1 hypothetical protein WS74_0484 [Weissella ceti]AIM64072.1 hypothetical protein WS105_0482 [Weissella ceti]ELA07117.1 hypothetical protein WCNC_06037 [Weissella ceti NC36]QVV91799.1 DUF2129 domain-containing protein [Weissella tructae]
MPFEKTERRALIVYLKNVRQARQLRRFGIVNYISEKMNYATIYMDEKDIATKKALIERLGFVDRVVESEWPNVDTTVGGERELIDFTVVADEELALEPSEDEEL